MYLRTDETEEAVSALEMTADCLSGAHADVYQWKWAVISLHNAAQGFMVLSLRGSNGLDVLAKKSARAWTEAVAEGRTPPLGGRLETYLELYSRTKGKRMLQYVHSNRFSPAGTQNESIRELNSLRNEFVHFLPKGWSLEVGGLPGIVIDVLAYLEFLGWDCGNVVWADPDLEDRARSALGLAHCEARSLDAIYAQSSQPG